MFSLSDATQAGFSSSQIQFNSSLMQDSFYLSQQVVQIGDVAALQTNGVLQFSLPGFSTQPFTAIANRVDYQNPDNYVWVGDLSGNEVGQILLVATEGRLNGFVQTANRYFTLMGIGTGFSLLLENNLSASEALVCGNEPTAASPEGAFDPCAEAMNTCPANIRILFLVTPEANVFLNTHLPALQGPIVKDRFQAVTESINQAFLNSGIPDKMVSSTSVDFFFGFTTDVDIDKDVAALADNDTAIGLRNQLRADVVILLTDRDGSVGGYTDPNGSQIFGTVRDIGPNNPLAFAIVEARFMLAPRFTVAHEFGHLLGARHNRTTNGGTDNTNVCSHGFRFIDMGGNVQRTILAGSPALNPGDAGSRILNYSNPAILFNGAATGTVNDDNARTLRNTGCIVESFRGPAEWSVYPDIPNEICAADITMNACAFATAGIPGWPGQPPFSWYWATNSSGIFPPDPPLGTPAGNECETFSIPAAGSSWFIHVWVMTSDFESYQATQKVKIYAAGSAWCYQFGLGSGERNGHQLQNDDLNLTQNNWAVSPNPSDGHFRILFQENPNVGGAATILNMLGQPVRKLVFSENIDFLDLDLGDAPAGIYFLSVQQEGKKAYRQIIKQ